jgi:hypothetical protein
MFHLIDWDGNEDNLTVLADISDAKLLSSSRQLNELSAADDILNNVSWDSHVDPKKSPIYAIAISSGIISGFVDSIFVKELSLKDAHEWGSQKINTMVIQIANALGADSKELADAIHFLEDKYPLASDGVTANFGSGLQHHLRDFTHHPSLLGLIASLLMQFTGKALGTDTAGELFLADVPPENIGSTFQEKLIKGTLSWFLHLVSDMAGSSSNPGKGTGIPGPILSLAKEVSALPIFKNAKSDEDTFRKTISRLFNGTLLAERDSNGKITSPFRFNLREEAGLTRAISSQSIAVAINDCCIKLFYYFWALHEYLLNHEQTSLEDLLKVDWMDLIPNYASDIRRMRTIASGTFCAIDLTDASIRSLLAKSHVGETTFWVSFALRINIPGICYFVVACAVDVRAETKSRKSRTKFQMLDLSPFQYSKEEFQLLYSLQRQMLLYDAELTTPSSNRKEKDEWLNEWETSILRSLGQTLPDPSSFFFDEHHIRSVFGTDHTPAFQESRLQIVLFNATLFEPYLVETPDGHPVKKTRKLDHDYLVEVLAHSTQLLDKNEIGQIRKTYKSFQKKISGQPHRIILGAAGTAAVMLASGSIAFAFAPVVAPIIATNLFGQTISGLSGAALTSASLAALGGGSLAAGGFGMAGGTTLISGSGAFVGLAGGAGTAYMTSRQQAAHITIQCAQLLALCQEILIAKHHDLDSVLSARYVIASLQADAKQSSSMANERVTRKLTKYYQRTLDELDKLIESAKV